MEKNNNIAMSVIVPVYNVEEFLPACMDSVMHQGDLRLEVILIDDGSTDRSGEIADQYAQQDSRIKVIHQENRGLSAARNTGLARATGDYIAFVDSDDRIKEQSLYELYRLAVEQQADVVMGKVQFHNPEESNNSPYRPVPEEMLNTLFNGKDCFSRLVKSGSYQPMVFTYIYRREFLEQLQICFEEGIIHEDELWTPQVLCRASRMVITRLDFYFYRQREGSIMQSATLQKRTDSLLQVTGRLMIFADTFEFSGEDGELKNWMYVNIFKLYSRAFDLLSRIKDTSCVLPTHYLDCFWRNCHEMMPEAQHRCRVYYRNAEAGLKKYTDWRTSDWVASVASQLNAGKKLMLIYNTMWNEDLTLKIEDVPADWLVTTDRRYFQQAEAVVFHLPDLFHVLEGDLDKPEGQLWVGWYLESEKNCPWFKSAECRETFDLWMSYRQDADVVYPHYRYENAELFSQKMSIGHKHNKSHMAVSHKINKSAGHSLYLKELMEHTRIDSYGRLFDNKKPDITHNTEAKTHIYRDYKFIIAFEDALDTDYVTEKFFEPLMAGSVPVYLGAPNIDDFAPGDHCFVDVRRFEGPQALANFINMCYEDEQLYAKFFEWKNRPLRKSFLRMAEMQEEHPLVRLCRVVDEKKHADDAD